MVPLEFSAAAAVGRAGGRGVRAVAGIVVLLPLCAIHGAVEEQVAAFRDGKAVFLQIAVCRCLLPHGFQLALHTAHNDQRQYDTDADGNGDPDHGQRLTGQIALVKGRAASCLCDKFVAEVCVGIEGSSIVLHILRTFPAPLIDFFVFLC